jgi:hypothetical protein
LGRKLPKYIGFWCTEEEHAVYKGWEEGGPEYLRMCVLTRNTGTGEDMRRRANSLKRKAQELMLEAKELEKAAEAEDMTAETDFPLVQQEYERLKIFKREREEQVRWLKEMAGWNSQVANEFLAWVNDDRSGEEDD